MESIWAMFEEHRNFPVATVPCFEVLYQHERGATSPVQADFVHQAIKQRYRQFWTETRKMRGDAMVERSQMFTSVTSSGSQQSEGHASAAHVLGAETYRAGKTVAEAWLSALSADDSASLLRLAREFYLFLEKETVEIDSIDDVVFDGNSRYFKIDRRKTVVDTVREIRYLISDQEKSRGRISTSEWTVTGEMRDEVLFNVYNTMVMKLKGMTGTAILSKTQYFKESRNGQIGLYYDDLGKIDHQRVSQKIRDYRQKGNRKSCQILF